jgi:chromosomal replication initiation ATPase DnaA
VSAAIHDEPRTLEEMNARAAAARRRMDDAARLRRPIAPKVTELRPGELGARAFGDAAAREEQALEARVEAERIEDEQRERYRATFADLPESPRSIISRIARAHRLSPNDIVGQRRTAPVVKARFDALSELRRIHPHRSLPWLGQQLGGRDHTTVLSALRKMGIK